jgi:hypothetical protein
MRIHSLSNAEVLRLLPPSPGQIVEVRGDDDEEFYGFLMKIPMTNQWQTLTLTNLACSVSLPDQPIQEFSIRVLQRKDTASLWLYPVFQGQFGILEAVEIQLQRFTPQALQEHVKKEGDFVKEYLTPSPTGIFAEWERVTPHPVLNVKEQTTWQTWYRKDITYKNMDVLRITGRVHKYSIQKTKKSLFPEMDTVTRKVIDSIKSLE